MTTATLTPRPFLALLALLEATPAWQPPKPEASQSGSREGTSGPTGSPSAAPGLSAQDLDLFTDRQIAAALQIDVLGRTPSGDIKAYSEYLHRTVLIPNVARLRYPDFLLHFGTPVRRCISQNNEEAIPGFYPIKDAREMLAHLGSVRLIGDESEMGLGIWPCKGIGEGVGEERKCGGGAVVNGGGGKASGAVGVGSGRAGAHGAPAGSCPCHDPGRPAGEQAETGADRLAAVILVNASEAARLDAERHLTRITHPRHGDNLLAFDSATHPWYDFDRLAELLDLAADPAWRYTVVDDLVTLWQRWRWRGPHDPTIVAGLVLATWVQSTWDWRPRIDILGGSNTGKTMLCGALAGLFAGLHLLTSDTTAAGLAQTIANQMLAVIVDEVDAKNRTKLAEQKKILEMLRSASRGTTRIRGSGNQKASHLVLRHLVWVAGITLSYDDQADRNRAVCLNLLPPLPEKAGKLQLPPADELVGLGQRSLATALWCVQEARRLAVELKDHPVPGIDQRLVESYAVPSAMIATALGYDGTKAAEFIGNMLDGQGGDVAVESDEANLIGAILGAHVQVAQDRKTVGQVIEILIDITADHRDAWGTALEARGIKVGFFGNAAGRKADEFAILMNYQAVRATLLRGTIWEAQPIDQVLRRLPGCVSGYRRIGGVKGRCAMLPRDEFVETYIGTTEEESDPQGTF